MNEPWPGDIYSDPTLVLFSGKADTINLQPLYNYVSDIIRQVDQNKIVFYEPTTTDYGHTHTGFTSVPGGEAYNDRSVYSYHIYCGVSSGTGEPQSPYLCSLIRDYFFHHSVTNYKRIGGGAFLTEWGNMPNTPASIDFINTVTST